MRKALPAFDYIDKKTQQKFHLLLSVFKKPATDKEYQALEKLLDLLIDTVKDEEDHPLAVAMQIIGDNLEDYDNQHYPPIGHNISEIDMVKYLMEKNNLLQKDLAEIFGGQANVSKFLNGERNLNKKQITALKKRFNISADFFIKS